MSRERKGWRAAAVAALAARRPAGVLLFTALVAALSALVVDAIPDASPVTRAVTLADHGRGDTGLQGMARILGDEGGARIHLAPATHPPTPAPPAVADAPPLRPHEVFGFAPYWALPQQQRFDDGGFTTIAYFALQVAGNGTLVESGSGWDGYESQDFADLVSRAHAAGDRVVLTVNCFSQHLLDVLTSSGSAARTLAAAVVGAIRAKNLDGVNIDFEGVGSQDAAGLVSLASTLSRAVHAFDAHDQVTVDTYASSAARAPGFYDVPALASVVDGLFVMAYDLNLAAAPSPSSPVTSTQFPDTLAAAEYAAAVPPAKVVFGTSWYGYIWPTTNGTVAADPSGAPKPVSYAEMASSGDPVYWDPVTDTSWTSFENRGQWYEGYFEDPESVYLVAQLARRYGFGAGAWALGMDGGDPRMTLALDGRTPGTGTGPPGPGWTPPSIRHSATAASSRTALGPSRAHPHRSATSSRASSSASVSEVGGTPGGGTGSSGSPAGGTSGSGTSGSGPTTTTEVTTTTAPTTTTTTTTTTSGGGTGGATTYRYSGVFAGVTVSLSRVQATAVPAGSPVLVGTVTGFVSDDPSVACLETTPIQMEVWSYGTSPTDVVTATDPGNCMTATFTFPVSAAPSTASG